MEIGPLTSKVLVTVGPDHSLVDTAKKMVDANVGSAVVTQEDGSPGIITERDLLRAMAAGDDPTTTRVSDYMTSGAIVASPSWDAMDAARRMIEGNFRHLVVVADSGRIEGVLSIRDLFRSFLTE